MVAQAETGNVEDESYDQISRVVKEMASKIAHDDSQISPIHQDRDGLHGFEVDHPVSYTKVYAKRQVSDDGWGYVWGRIHVVTEHKGMAVNKILSIAAENDMHAVDFWQQTSDLEEEVGQHGNPVIRFALE